MKGGGRKERRKEEGKKERTVGRNPVLVTEPVPETLGSQNLGSVEVREAG